MSVATKPCDAVYSDLANAHAICERCGYSIATHLCSSLLRQLIDAERIRSEPEMIDREINELFSRLSDAKREDVFYTLQDKWCQWCGRTQPKGRCQCRNDE